MPTPQASDRRFRSAVARMRDGFALLEPDYGPSAEVRGFRMHYANAAGSDALALGPVAPTAGTYLPVPQEPDGVYSALLALLAAPGQPMIQTDALQDDRGRLLQHDVVRADDGLVLVVSRDRTAERHVASVQDQLGRVARHSADGIVSVSQDGLVAAWNPAAERLTGVAEAEARGRRALEVLALDPPAQEQLAASLRSDASTVVEGQLHEHRVSIRIDPIWAGPHTRDGHVAIVRDLSDSQQAQRLSRALEAERVMQRELHHRVKNNLQVVVSLLNMAVRQAETEGVPPRTALEGSRDRIRSVAMLHEQLHREAHLDAVSMQPYLERLGSDLVTVHGSNARVTIEPGRVALPLDAAMPVALVVNELLTNAVKHGGDGVSVHVVLEPVAEGSALELRVHDDGPPFPPDVAHASAGLGMRLVRALADQLGAVDLEIDNEPSKGVRIRWPTAEEVPPCRS